MDAQTILSEKLKDFCASDTLIVGIGNTLKGDDAAGPLVCEQLKDIAPQNVIDAATVPENYIQTIIKKAPKILLIIDAIDFGAAPGSIEIFETDRINSLAVSTHAPSPRLFIDLICKTISPQVYFIGIQPAQTALGQPLTPQVDQAVKSLVEILTLHLKP